MVGNWNESLCLEDCQGRSEISQDRRKKTPRFGGFEKSPASVALSHRWWRRKIAEHAGLRFLPQAIAFTANVNGDGMMQQAVQDSRGHHMLVKNVAPGRSSCCWLRSLPLSRGVSTLARKQVRARLRLADSGRAQQNDVGGPFHERHGR